MDYTTLTEQHKKGFDSWERDFSYFTRIVRMRAYADFDETFGAPKYRTPVCEDAYFATLKRVRDDLRPETISSASGKAKEELMRLAALLARLSAEKDVIIAEFRSCVKRYGPAKFFLDIGRSIHGPGSITNLYYLSSLIAELAILVLGDASQDTLLYLQAELNDSYVDYIEDRIEPLSMHVTLVDYVNEAISNINGLYEPGSQILFSEVMELLQGYDTICSANEVRWLTVRVAAEISHTVEGDRSNIMSSYGQLLAAAKERSMPSSENGLKYKLVMDDRLSYLDYRLLLPYILILEDGRMAFETCEGFRMLVIRHEVKGIGTYVYTPFTSAEMSMLKSTRIRNALIGRIYGLRTTSTDFLRYLGELIFDSSGAIEKVESIQSAKETQREEAATSFYEWLVELHPNSQWKSLVKNSISVTRLMYWSLNLENGRKIIRRIAAEMARRFSVGWLKIVLGDSSSTVATLKNCPYKRLTANQLIRRYDQGIQNEEAEAMEGSMRCALRMILAHPNIQTEQKRFILGGLNVIGSYISQESTWRYQGNPFLMKAGSSLCIAKGYDIGEDDFEIDRNCDVIGIQSWDMYQMQIY